MTRRSQQCDCERCTRRQRRLQQRKNRRKPFPTKQLPVQNHGSLSSIDQTCSVGDICGNNICIIIAPHNYGNSSSLNKSDHNRLENTRIFPTEDEQNGIMKNQLSPEQFEQIMAVINGN